MSTTTRKIRPLPASLLVAAFVPLLFLGACTSTPRIAGPATPGQAVNAFAPAYMRGKHIVGLSVALADADGTMWSGGFGLADRATGGRFTENTRSSAGSLSKLLTCAAVMQLVEEGRVDLDAPLSRYLPEFSIGTGGWSVDAITIRSMLSQHSGLPSDRKQGFISWNSRPADYPDAMLDLPGLLREERAATPPDTLFSYSNLAYSLLGDLVARVSGTSFAEYMRLRVLERLGMRDSSFLMSPEDRGAAARGYGGLAPGPIPYIRDLPAGSLISTASDLGRFISAMVAASEGRGDFLRAETVREMWTAQNEGVPLDFDFRVGLTWWITELPGVPGEPFVAHGGDLDSFHALLGINPARGLGVAVMANSVDGTGSFSLAPVAAVAMRALIESTTGESLPPAPPASLPAPFPAGWVGRVAGFYATPMGLAQVNEAGVGMRVGLAGTDLQGVYHEDGFVTLEARVAFLKVPVPTLDEISLTFEYIGSEPFMCMRVRGVLIAPCARIQPPVIPACWMARVGAYRVANPDDSGTTRPPRLRYDRSTGFLLISYELARQVIELPIEPISCSEARTMGVGRGLGELIRAQRDTEGERLLFSGYIMRKEPG